MLTFVVPLAFSAVMERSARVPCKTYRSSVTHIKLDSAFLCARSSVELKSTLYVTVIYADFALSSCHIEVCFQILKVRDCLKN